jgi:predicted nucleic acid-binding protein
MERKVCLDTDALIVAYKSKEGKERIVGNYTTCISEFEFLRGIKYLGKDIKAYKADLEERLGILCIDNYSILKASEIYSELAKEGSLIDDPDLLIGSICISNDIPIVTNNLKHFIKLKKFGLKILTLKDIGLS